MDNNQQILEKLVNREVIMLATDIVDELMKLANGGGEFVDAFDLAMQEASFIDINDEDEELQYPEPLEYWFITEWLASKLEAKNGETIIRHFNNPIWGRTTSGQAISMDYVIK